MAPPQGGAFDLQINLQSARWTSAEEFSFLRSATLSINIKSPLSGRDRARFLALLR
jgi:hypothetical protein